MATKNQKVHGVIHTAAGTAAVGAGLAQLPGDDEPERDLPERFIQLRQWTRRKARGK